MGVKDYHMELQPLTSIHLHSNLDYELSANSSMSRVYMFIAIGSINITDRIDQLHEFINCKVSHTRKRNWHKKSGWFITKQPCWPVYFRSYYL